MEDPTEFPLTFVSSDEEGHAPDDRGVTADSSVASYFGYKDYFCQSAARIKRMIQCPKGKRRGPRGGVVVPFPVKLYAMLEGVQKEGLEHIVNWAPHGRCFIVHNPSEFVQDVMPRYVPLILTEYRFIGVSNF
jgi:HSF-type DNA-binding